MRGLVITVVVALSICGAALGGGWAIQAGVLPPADHADRVAANAAAWLLRYRVTEASLRVDGRRTSSLCLHSWFPRRNGTLARGALLVLGDGTRIADNGGGVRVARPSGTKPWHFAAFLLELAGCPGFLGKRVAGAAVDGTVTVTRSFAAGRPALALRLPARLDSVSRMRFLRDRLTLYVSARTYRPVAVAGVLGRVKGASLIRLVKATPGLLARFSATRLHVP